MPVITLEPDTHLKIKYTVPPNGLIEYFVEADRPVDTYVLDAKGLREFNSGDDDYVYSYYGGFANRRKHQQELRLPFKGSWYLIIMNSDKKYPVAVHYEVSA